MQRGLFALARCYIRSNSQWLSFHHHKWDKRSAYILVGCLLPKKNKKNRKNKKNKKDKKSKKMKNRGAC